MKQKQSKTEKLEAENRQMYAAVRMAMDCCKLEMPWHIIEEILIRGIGGTVIPSSLSSAEAAQIESGEYSRLYHYMHGEKL